MTISIPFSLVKENQTEYWTTVPTDLSWSGYQEQLQCFDKDDLLDLMNSLHATPALYSSTLTPSQAVAIDLHTYFPDTMFSTNIRDFNDNPLPHTGTNEGASIPEDEDASIPEDEGASIPEDAARYLSLAIVFQTYAFLLRMFSGSQINNTLPPKDSTVETHGQYIFPLLKRAKELRDQAISLGLSSKHFINMPINYCLVGYTRDQQVSLDTLDTQLLLHAQGHSLTDYGYIQLSTNQAIDALKTFEKANTRTALALVGEHHMNIPMKAHQTSKNSLQARAWQFKHKHSLHLAEKYLSKAAEKGNQQATIRLVELYFMQIQVCSISEGTYLNNEPHQDYLNHLDKAQTELIKAMLMHKENPLAFAKEYQEDFSLLFNQYLDHNDIQRIIEEAQEHATTHTLSKHVQSLYALPLTPQRPGSNAPQEITKSIPRTHKPRPGFIPSKKVLTVAGICALAAFLVKLGSSLDILSFFNQNCDEHKKYLCG